MTEPVKQGPNLLEEIENTEATASPALWWLGQSGFVLKFQDIVFYVDPCLSNLNGRTRLMEPPLRGDQVINADMILCTHKHDGHMDPGALPAILKASPRCRVVMPKSAAGHAFAIGIPYERMTTTDSDLRVEYFKSGLYARIYSAPSAHPSLDWTPLGGYPNLGYIIRFGDVNIYHAGDCKLYDGIVGRLRPYAVSVALLPISGNGSFDITEAAQLAEDIGAKWLVPMHYGTFAEQDTDIGHFIDHMLGYRPSTGFKVFQPGERWVVPR
jgi:L-ascorbate metabolism protein UlaG (beta-lactamase superfamily)